ncbi:unnamed protein product [Brassica rapa subsp. trilocularis]
MIEMPLWLQLRFGMPSIDRGHTVMSRLKKFSANRGDDTVGWVLGCLGEFNKEKTSPITHVDIITLCQGVLVG